MSDGRDDSALSDLPDAVSSLSRGFNVQVGMLACVPHIWTGCNASHRAVA